MQEKKLDIQKSNAGDVTIIKLSGEFDHETEDQFRIFEQELENLELKKIVCSLKGISWLDSKGLGRLILFFKRVKEYGGTIVFTDISPQILKVIRYGRLEIMLKIMDSEKEALAAFGNQ
ncbi:MAG: anti-sigma factor antagonist [Candidatus Wallbacteria bacterium]|nr:anti-sigma factor antagonist [Candidatus Wallbacteria bacterium]